MAKNMQKNIKHLFLLTTLAGGTIHLANRFVTLTAEMKNMLGTEDGNYYDWKNGQIYYTKRGSGSPILLIHELNPVSSSYEWCRFAKKLEKKHTVYTLDLLGCGRSDKPYLTYTSYLYVQLITDFINEVIDGQPDVIATGASVSFVTLAEHMNPHLLHSIIAVNPPAPQEFDRTPDRASSVRKMLLELPIIGTFLYNLRTHEKNIQRMFHDTYFSNPQLTSSKMLDAYYESAHMDSSHGKYLMASIDGYYTNNTISHALKKLAIPFYVIEGRDNPNDVAIVNAYAKQNPLVETAYISHTKLLPQLEAPDKLYDVVKMLLQKA